MIHFTSPAGWLPVHRDQLRAQRSVTSMGKLYLLMWIYIVLYDTYLYRALWHVWSVNPYENSTTVKWAISCYLPAANSIAAVLPNPLLDEWWQEAWVWTTCPESLQSHTTEFIGPSLWPPTQHALEIFISPEWIYPVAKETKNNKLHNLTINMNSQHVQHDEVGNTWYYTEQNNR